MPRFQPGASLTAFDVVDCQDGTFEATLSLPALSGVSRAVAPPGSEEGAADEPVDMPYECGPFVSDRLATRKAAQQHAASQALDINWPDTLQSVHELYEAQRAGKVQAAPGTNRKGLLNEGLQRVKGSHIVSGDIVYDTVPTEEGGFVSTVSFPGLGREDAYIGMPQSTQKEAEHSAADIAILALEEEFEAAKHALQERKERQKERHIARKTLGLHAALQFLLGPEAPVLNYSYSFEVTQMGGNAFEAQGTTGYVATLSVPQLSERTYRSAWRPSMEEAEKDAVESFYSVMAPEFDSRGKAGMFFGP